jgi:hypothetical protein
VDSFRRRRCLASGTGNTDDEIDDAIEKKLADLEAKKQTSQLDRKQGEGSDHD